MLKQADMKSLKLLQEKDENIPANMPDDHKIKMTDDPIDLFPLPRYFQVHFQHIHENNHAIQRELVQLKDYAAKVDQKIEYLVALLSHCPEQLH